MPTPWTKVFLCGLALLAGNALCAQSTGQAPDKELIAVEQIVAAGKREEAKKALEKLRKEYPKDLRLVGLASYLEDPTEAFALAPPPLVRLANQPAEVRIAVKLVEQRFQALRQMGKDEARQQAPALLAQLDPVLEHTPGLFEAVCLRAQLAVIADDTGRGRSAVQLLEAWDWRKSSQPSPSLHALIQAVEAKGWLPKPDALERIEKKLKTSASPTPPRPSITPKP